jgi:hypothetical protein
VKVAVNMSGTHAYPPGVAYDDALAGNIISVVQSS